MIYLYLFGTCFHFIYVFMIIANKVFKDITVDLIKDWKSLPSGKNLKKYNEDYATEKIKELL